MEGSAVDLHYNRNLNPQESVVYICPALLLMHIGMPPQKKKNNKKDVPTSA